MGTHHDEVQISVMEEPKGESYRRKVVLYGILTVPSEQGKKRIVLFAHGSGSGRHSPRNQYVASILNKEFGIGTLLVDLLDAEEQKIDEKTREYRFNIGLLANRLAAVTDWLLANNDKTQNLSIGYFGASTGAAAALIAGSAEHRSNIVKAIVSRGGRPDLANSSSLKKIQSATLFLVGSRDNMQVIALNQKAFQQLISVKEKRLIIIPGAGHLFEEPGTLEEVARHTASWFERYL
jgi:putative phosphoribosyl transferase